MPYVSTVKKKQTGGTQTSGYVSTLARKGAAVKKNTAPSYTVPFPSSFGTKTSTPQFSNADTVKDVRSVANSIGSGFLRATAAYGSAITSVPEQARALVTSTPVRPGTGEFKPRGDFQEALYGTADPISLASIGKEFGAEEAGLPAPLIGAFSGILDLSTGGGARGIKILTEGIKVANTVEKVAPFMRAAGFSDDIIQQYAPVLAKLDDGAKIEDALLAAEKLQNSTQVATKVDPLVVEARKYGSADEFVKAKAPEFRGAYGDRTPDTYWLTSKEDNALRFGRDAKAVSETGELYDATGVHRGMDDVGIRVENFGLKPSAKLLDTRTVDVPKNLDTFKSSNGVFPGADREKINTWAKQNGYDGVLYEHTGGNVHTAVFSKDSLLTKEELTDIYAQAKATPQTNAEKTLPLPPTLEKTLLQGPDGRGQRALIDSSTGERITPELGRQSSRGTVTQTSRVVEDAPAKAPVRLDDSTYQANRESLKKDGLTKVREGLKDAFDSVGKGADVLLGAISTRLGNIDPSLKTAIRKYEFKLSMAVQKDHKRVMPFLKTLKKSKITAGDYADLDLALKNGDVAKTDELLSKYGLTEDFKVIRATLDDLYKRAKDVGYDVGYEKNYFPRTIKDSGGLLEYLEKGDDWSLIDQMIKAREEALQRYLTTDEKASVVNNLIRGYGGKITLTETGAMKARQIDIVDANLNQFYNDSLGSLINYIDNTNDAIEARTFFGKTGKAAEAEQFGNIEDSIGSYILNLFADGKIKPSQEKELTRILRARFNEVGTSGAIQAYKNLSYIDTMGSFSSAITQIGDLAFALYAAGPVRTASALASAVTGKSKITRADLGIEKIAAEFSDSSKSAKAVSAVFKLIGLEKMDAIGKETLVNAIMKKLSSQANKPTSDFYKQLETVFGDDADAIARTVEDLKAGRVTEDTKLLAFNKLLDFQPVALSEMPEMYLKGGNGRIFYMLKTYTVKLFDVYRNEVFSKLNTPGQRAEGIKSAVKLAAALIAANATADEIKDFMLNRETSLTDRTVDNVLRLAGFSKYTIYKAREEGIGSAVLKTILPPIKFIDSVYKDIASGGEKGLETIDSIPIGGKLYYWWFGKGADKTEKKRDAADKSEFGGGSSASTGELPYPGEALGAKALPLPPGL